MKLQFIRHRSLEACIAAYFHTRPSRCFSLKFPRRGFWEFYDQHGKRHRWSMARTLRSCRTWGTWGWAQGKRRVHLWIAPYAEFNEIVRLLAHEIGHTQKPHLPPAREEQKAAKYETVALLAVKMARRLAKEPKP